jgi:hypothetical protein
VLVAERRYPRPVGVPLGQGKVAVIDDEDWPLVRRYRWWAKERHGRTYAYARIENRFSQLHRFLLGAADGQEIDHRNGDGLDCRKENLRFATRSQNCANRVIPEGGRGVTWHAQRQKFMARIKQDGRSRFLGPFESREDALLAYDKAARETFGEFARVNFDTLPRGQGKT